jgi:hypothetical protein
MLRKSIPGVLLLGLLCFFFTFAIVSCNGQPLVALTGIQMVTGSSVSAPQMFGPPKVQQIPPEPSVIVAFLCGIAALGVSLLPGKKTSYISAGVSAIAVIALFIFKSNLDSEAMRQTGGMIHPEFGNGFWGAVIFFFGALVLGLIQARGANEVVPNKQMASRKCVHCGTEAPQEAKFCRDCAKPLDGRNSSEAGMDKTGLCFRCGASNLAGTRYCKKCGQALPGTNDETQRPHLSSQMDVSSRNSFSGIADVSAVPVSQLPAGQREKESTTAEKTTAKPELAIELSSPESVSSVKVSTATETKKHSPVLLGGITLGIVLIGLIIGWHLVGVELQLVTEPSGATVVIDGKLIGKSSEQGGALVVPHLTHGSHSLSVTHDGFEPWSDRVPFGWFEFSRQLSTKLSFPSFPLTVLTVPANAKVQVDGQDLGATDASGKLTISKVPRGQHVVIVTLDGYPSWSHPLWIASPSSIRADLAAEAAAAQPLAEVTTDSVSTAPQVSRSPEIASIGTILPQADQTINITGQGFGEQAPYDGNSRYILVTDLTRNWNAGNSGGNDLVTLRVARWTETQITLEGFTGAYGRGWSLSPGDQVRIQIWNPQSGAGPATSNVTVAARLGD